MNKNKAIENAFYVFNGGILHHKNSEGEDVYRKIEGGK
jgi:hypothetical protein